MIRLYTIRCPCGKTYKTQKKTQIYCSKECANKFSTKIRLFGQTGFKKLKECSLCHAPKRLFDFPQGTNEKGLCLECMDRLEYKKKGLPAPVDVVQLIQLMPGQIIDYGWFRTNTGLEVGKVYELVASMVTAGYLLGQLGRTFVLGDRVNAGQK